ncbi:MAG: glycosyltransferase, partial [Bacteroidetes bacterium]|nr:glycosyltransferase [Bacteroidota bacterium]
MEKETEKMRVLLVSEYFYPRSKGGTEKYVHELARGLRSHAHEVFILTVSDDSAVYDFDGFAVHNIAFCSDKQSRVIANIDPPDNLDAFREVLSNISPDVVHFHTLTTSAGIFHIQAAATMGAKLFFTSHIPGNTCIRGDLMRYGTSGCDGRVRLRGCLSCYMNGRGLPRGLAEPLSVITRTLKSPDPLWRAADIKKELLDQIRETCRFVIVLSEWQRRVYLRNGFTDENLIVSRHIFKKAAPLRSGNEKTPVTVGFAGRISPEKGLHVLLSAFRRLDASVFKLSIAGI